MQNSDFCTRITYLYGSLTSPVVLCMQNSVLTTRISSSLWVPDLIYGFGANKTACLALEYQVYIGSSPHLWFCACKTETYDQNYKSLSVPALICGFCKQNSDFMSRIISLHGSQTSPVDLCKQNCMLTSRIASLYGSQTSCVDLCMQNGDFCTRITSLYRSQPSSVVFAKKTAT